MRAFGAPGRVRAAPGAEEEAHQRRDRPEGDPGDVDDEEDEHHLLDAGQLADRQHQPHLVRQVRRSAATRSATSAEPREPDRRLALEPSGARGRSAAATAPAWPAAPRAAAARPRRRRRRGERSAAPSIDPGFGDPAVAGAKLHAHLHHVGTLGVEVEAEAQAVDLGVLRDLGVVDRAGVGLRHQLHRRGADRPGASPAIVDDEPPPAVASGADQRALDPQKPVRDPATSQPQLSR